VITEAGNDPKVAGTVYISAFAPDKGESVATLIKDPPPGAPVPPILPPRDGYLFLDRTKFRASFAAEVDARVGEGVDKRYARCYRSAIGAACAKERGCGSLGWRSADGRPYRDRQPRCVSDEPANNQNRGWTVLSTLVIWG